MQISRIKVAEEQLIEAINLYFNSECTVPVHSLVCNAHEILDKLCHLNGKDRSVVQQGSRWIRSGKEKEFWKKINEARNFFKHNDNDSNPETKLDWNPELSEHYILDAIMLFQRFTISTLIPEMICFQVWYRSKNPEMWNDSMTEFNVVFDQAKNILDGLSKKEAYNMMLQVMRQTTT